MNVTVYCHDTDSKTPFSLTAEVFDLVIRAEKGTTEGTIEEYGRCDGIGESGLEYVAVPEGEPYPGPFVEDTPVNDHNDHHYAQSAAALIFKHKSKGKPREHLMSAIQFSAEEMARAASIHPFGGEDYVFYSRVAHSLLERAGM